MPKGTGNKKSGREKPPEVSAAQIETMASGNPQNDDLTLPKAQNVPRDEAKVAVYLDWEAGGKAAQERFKEIQDLRSGGFPMGGLVATIASAVQHDQIKPSSKNGDRQVIRMTPEIVDGAFKAYVDFQRSLPLDRESAAEMYGRVTGFLVATKEKMGNNDAGKEDLELAEEKVRLAHRIIQANALSTDRLNWRKVGNLVEEAEELIKKASLDNIAEQVRTSAPAAGQTPEAVEAAIARVMEKLPSERFFAMRDLLRSLRTAASDVEAVASRRREHHQAPNHNGPHQKGQRFQRRRFQTT